MVCTSVIPAFGRQRQEALKFKASLSYMVRPCLKKVCVCVCCGGDFYDYLHLEGKK
jgi:hypothetical protein